MKKTVLFAAFVLGSLSCSKEFAVEPQVFTLEASMPGGLTKVTVAPRSEGEYPLLWAEGDVITVNGVTSLPLPSSRAGGKQPYSPLTKASALPIMSCTERRLPPRWPLLSFSSIRLRG